jgi:hypothetical protein
MIVALSVIFVFTSVLLSLAEGDVLADADVQKAALNVIINSVCGPATRVCIDVSRDFIRLVRHISRVFPLMLKGTSRPPGVFPK